jgi:hypothetical protein
MHARTRLEKATFDSISLWEPQRVKMLLRISYDVFQILNDAVTVNIVIAFLGLIAAQGIGTDF